MDSVQKIQSMSFLSCLYSSKINNKKDSQKDSTFVNYESDDNSDCGFHYVNSELSKIADNCKASSSILNSLKNIETFVKEA